MNYEQFYGYTEDQRQVLLRPNAFRSKRASVIRPAQKKDDSQRLIHEDIPLRKTTRINTQRPKRYLEDVAVSKNSAPEITKKMRVEKPEAKKCNVKYKIKPKLEDGKHAGNMQKSDNKESKNIASGIFNVGNTCYASAAIAMACGLSWFNKIASLRLSPIALKVIDVLKMTRIVEEEGASMASRTKLKNSFNDMLETMQWTTTYRRGLGTENDASEFLRLLIKKTVSDLRQKNVEFEIQRLAADADGDPIFEITLETKSHDDLLKLMKDTATARGKFAEAIFFEISRTSENERVYQDAIPTSFTSGRMHRNGTLTSAILFYPKTKHYTTIRKNCLNEWECIDDNKVSFLTKDRALSQIHAHGYVLCYKFDDTFYKDAYHFRKTVPASFIRPVAIEETLFDTTKDVECPNFQTSQKKPGLLDCHFPFQGEVFRRNEAPPILNDDVTIPERSEIIQPLPCPPLPSLDNENFTFQMDDVLSTAEDLKRGKKIIELRVTSDQRQNVNDVKSLSEIQTDDTLDKTCNDLENLFRSCSDASHILTSIETELYQAKILCHQRKFDPLPMLERLLFELASDPHLSNGLFYSITLRSTIAGKMRILTRYIESGCYDGFFQQKGHLLITKNLQHPILPYKVYSMDDFKNCPIIKTTAGTSRKYRDLVKGNPNSIIATLSNLKALFKHHQSSEIHLEEIILSITKRSEPGKMPTPEDR